MHYSQSNYRCLNTIKQCYHGAKKIGDNLEFNTQPIYHLTVRPLKINTFRTGNMGKKLIAPTLKEERNRLHTK